MFSAAVLATAAVLSFVAVVALDSDAGPPKVTHQTLQADAHMARYVLMAKVEFPTRDLALHVREEIERGDANFMEVVQQQQQDGERGGHDTSANGQTGLLTIDRLPVAVAEIAFDVRLPTSSEHAANLHGPICTSTGCVIFTVFQRYRRSFFSDAWYDVEEFARNSGGEQSFEDLLSQIEKEDSALDVVFMVWPEEHRAFKRLKLQQVRIDLKRIGQADPTTQPMPLPPKADMVAHDALMQKRKVIFATIKPTVIEEHPEIYAMSLEQIAEQGWISKSVLDGIDEGVQPLVADEGQDMVLPIPTGSDENEF
jgi:hypothetical protein